MNVVITGGSKGLGKSIADAFANHGWNIYLCSRNKDTLTRTGDELIKKYPSIVVKTKAFDISDKGGAKDFADWIIMLGVEVDVLVNNAGSFEPGSIHAEQDGVLESMINANLYSAYHVTRHLLPKMMRRKRGHIFNMCSIASLQAYPNGGAYSISKFALAGFSKNLREEMKSYNIKVTAVYPGAVFTDSWAESGVDPGRIMEAEDIAKVIYSASTLSPQATVEDIVIRPQAGDL